LGRLTAKAVYSLKIGHRPEGIRIPRNLSREHLFVNSKTGEPYTTIYKVWCRLRDDAGLPHLRLHDLRHQYASFLMNSGRTLYEVQQILGHSDPTVIQRYAHQSTKALQDAANSASDIISEAMRESA
jgi:integrase